MIPLLPIAAAVSLVGLAVAAKGASPEPKPAPETPSDASSPRAGAPVAPSSAESALAPAQVSRFVV
jgi:hypothetical protein